jgi:hypothetical protein
MLKRVFWVRFNCLISFYLLKSIFRNFVDFLRIFFPNGRFSRKGRGTTFLVEMVVLFIILILILTYKPL